MNTLKNLLSLNDDERLLAEVRTYQEKLISNAEEPIWVIKIGFRKGAGHGSVQHPFDFFHRFSDLPPLP